MAKFLTLQSLFIVNGSIFPLQPLIAVLIVCFLMCFKIRIIQKIGDGITSRFSDPAQAFRNSIIWYRHSGWAHFNVPATNGMAYGVTEYTEYWWNICDQSPVLTASNQMSSSSAHRSLTNSGTRTAGPYASNNDHHGNFERSVIIFQANWFILWHT